MATELTARVELEEKMRFIGHGNGEQGVVIDYPPPLGDDSGIRGGLQLLLMALAACMGQTVMPLLRKMRQNVEGCVVEARGRRREEHPTVLTEIHLLFLVRGTGLDATQIRKAVDLAETWYCPVHAMLKGSAPIVTKVELVEGAKTP